MNVLTQLPRTIEEKVHAFQTYLESKGYEVARGSCNLFTIDDCKYAVEALGQCMGNNPAAPYVNLSVPHWNNEYVDEYLKDIFGPLPAGTSGTYRLDQREAIVVFGLLPPPAKYFGMQTYVFSRTGTLNEKDPIYQHLPDPAWRKLLFSKSPNTSRVLVFSSIGDSTNNAVITRQSGSAFNEERSFIITPDARIAREVTSALVQTGISDSKDIFTEPVSPQLVRVGLTAQDDDFLTLIRYAQPEDKDAGDRWRHELPLAVLRVREKTPASAPEPLPIPSYETKGGRSELGLKADLNDLVEAVKQQWNQRDASTTEFQSLQVSVDLIGHHCLARPMNCLGDTQDADYQVSPSVNFDQGQVVAVVGTLGTETGNATYVGLSVNRVAVLTGVANISDAELKETAKQFSDAVANTDKFYVYYFARDCSGLPNGLNLTEELVPPGETVKIMQRDYIVPGTERGPDPKHLLNPITIVFDGNKRPKTK